VFGKIKNFFISTKALATSPLYAQALIVVLAFALMVILSYLFVSKMERESLRKNVKSVIETTELNIKADLLEPETMLGGISETIRDIIIQENDINKVHEYIEHINEYVHANADKRLSGVIGFHADFNADSALFWSNAAPEWMPKNRLWYTAAIEANGDIGQTPPYIDIYTNTLSMTFSRLILDEDGQFLGIVCLDILLDRIRQFAVDTRFTENGYGFLFSSDLKLLAHPDPLLIGTALHDIKSGLAIFEDEIMRTGTVTESTIGDYRGIKSIVFVEKLHNGWYMGVMVPKSEFYEGTRTLAFILTVLGAMFALIVSAILIRMIAEKQKSEERTQLMLDATPLCVSFWSKDYKIIDCNQEAVYLYELTSKQEYLDRFYELSPKYQPDGSLTAEKAAKYLKKAFDEGYSRFEMINHNLSGELIPVEITLLRDIYRGENIVVGYTRDLREQKAMQREMQRAQVAEDSNKAKSNFLARVSHEVRTPMNAILGITEIQLQKEKNSLDIQEAFGKIHDSGYLLLNIINDILDLSKIEAGKLELSPVNYDVPSLINDTVHLNVMRYDSKPIEFNLHVDENIPVTLFGDELRIKQILNNLLSNAFKYTDRGEVTLSVSAEYPQQKEENRLMLIFRVADTGQGMTEEQVNKLYDEYTRFNTEANRTTEGTGLGMSITRSLILMMNGEISVESDPDKGSTFTVRLPQETVGADTLGKEMVETLQHLRLGKIQQMEKAPQLVREYMPYGRVLIVDDVETNLYVAKGLLAPYGLSIETAASGFEAIEKIKNGSTYDIIFMDHFMPKMDGIEATKIIRNLGYNQPIVALTANALSGQAELFIANDFDGYISKPIDIRQLNASLNKLIRDKYPLDVVQAARQQKDRLKKSADNETQQRITTELAEIFIRDAKKALTVLESICKKGDACDDDDIQNYFVTAHAMKSALANIGEKEISSLAQKLEQAGRERNTDIIMNETVPFLIALREAMNKIKPEEKTGEGKITGEEQAYLREKLIIIEKACLKYDKKAAKKMLSELKEKTWPDTEKEMLDTIAGLLLHSEFEKAADIAKNY
jgi:signal transduction histidine kinase/DNA-binding response OmpR family regulator